MFDERVRFGKIRRDGIMVLEVISYSDTKENIGRIEQNLSEIYQRTSGMDTLEPQEIPWDHFIPISPKELMMSPLADFISLHPGDKF